MAEYHLLGGGGGGGRGGYSLSGSGMMMEESSAMVGTTNYSHAAPHSAAAAAAAPPPPPPGMGSGMMSPTMSTTPTQNPNALLPGMIPQQQQQQQPQQQQPQQHPSSSQAGTGTGVGNISSYHQTGTVHGYPQGEVPQKLHHYSNYGSQTPSSNVSGGQYVPGSRLHHLGDSLMPPGSQPQQQPSPRPVTPNQMSTYQNRAMPGAQFGQRHTQPNTTAVQLPQNQAQYPTQFSSVSHQLQQQPQHTMQHSNEVWQGTVGHTQHSRPCMPSTQVYPQPQQATPTPPGQHGTNALPHSSVSMQGPRPSTPNQNQYMTGQEYTVQRSAAQPNTMQRPVYLTNSPSSQTNSHIGHAASGTSQTGGSQLTHVPLSQTEQVMPAYSQGPYAATSQSMVSRPHYNATSTGNALPHTASNQLIGQPMVGMRPVQQMNYPAASPRMNSGQQHAGTLPPGSPARLSQYHSPYSPSQPYPSSTTQPSPHAGGGAATPPHLSYPNTQPVVQAPTSPQYRSPYPSQVTQSPQHLTPTPPAGSPMPPTSHTPDRLMHTSSSTPQSQGSYPSPSATHMSSPGQGLSPGNTGAPSNSLQHLEQMVMPRMGTGPTNTSTGASPVSGTPNTMISHTPAVGASYYGHLSQQHSQTHHQHHSSATGDTRPQPQSPAFTHMSPQQHAHHHFVGQAPVSMGQPSPVVGHTIGPGHVPNSQPVQQPGAGVIPRANSSIAPDDRMLSGQHGASPVVYNTANSGNVIQPVVGPDANISHHHNMNNSPSHLTPLTNSNHQYHLGKSAYQVGNTSYEVQQIQQELQQLYSLHQTPENQQKIAELQEQLRYLQSQTNTVSSTASSMPPNATSQPLSSHFPHSPVLYNSGNQGGAYLSQPMQQHTQHYSPQMQPPEIQQDNQMLPSPQSHPVIQELGTCTAQPPMPTTEQDPLGLQYQPQPYPNSGVDTMMALPQPEAVEPPQDPYEMIIQDEPPKKTKKRYPKGESKKPKTPKPKKPSKSKAKNPPAVATGEGDPVLTKEGDGSILTPNEQEIKPPKKPKKRKAAKDKENKESAEGKEPKPKKAKKSKTPKEPKVPKESKGTKEAKEPNEANKDVEAGENKEGENKEENKEAKDSKPKKESKEKKESKSKSQKTPSSKESKPKSTPKKKLPKIALKFSKKKKRKRFGSSENSDLEVTPPPSPQDGEGVQKRRSARNTKRKKYTDDIELHLTDDETIEIDLLQSIGGDSKAVQVVVDYTEDYMQVEKIMAMRTVKIAENTVDSDGENTTPTEVEEFFVKYRNLSYIHCEWKSIEELEKGDRKVAQKIKRFKQKKDSISNFFDFLEEEPFNPDYVEVDRVLDVNEIVDPIIIGDINESIEDKAKDANSSETDKKQETSESLISNKSENDVQEESAKTDIEISSDINVVSGNLMESEHSENLEVEKLSEIPNPSIENLPSDVEKQPLPPPPAAAAVEILDDTSTENTLIDSPKKACDEKPEEVNNEIKEAKESIVSDGPSEVKPKLKSTLHFLVKWRGLPYEESTWELEDDVDRKKIEQFYLFRQPPPKEKWKTKRRPKPSEWKKIEDSPVYKGDNTLREYQLEGVNWLTFCWYNSQNCILADEMGLGKTIQSITYFNEINNYGIPGPFLVIAPLSTIGNWQREFETWTELNAITYHGSSASRNMIQEYEMYYKNEKGERIKEVYKFQVMITTFEIVLTDCLELREIPWRCVIIDEAHRLKNRNCKLLEGLRLLDVEHRVLLTGTPLQNNVEELFSLLNFLEPNRFSSTEAFLEEFGDLKTEAQVDKLKALLKPMMLRRLKEDVEKSLAPKEETVIEVELTNVQKKYYRAILERNFSFLTKGGSCSNMPNLMNTMMELRKCCIHPFLINGAEEQIINDYKSQHDDYLDVPVNAMVQASGKLVLIDKLLPRLRANDHRVLVFSQMVRCLDILEDYMVQKRYPYERIDGRVRGNLRQAAIDRFCKKDSDRFVFLLCTRAGGLGINLTAADTVIIFDSDWNPQNDLQAQARCHRIGQSKAVKVYRLICRNTYEREMFDKASLKLGLDKAVLQSMNSQKENLGVNQQMSKKEIEDLLRKGAYGALMEDDNAGDKFCEEDIDQILQRRTHVIQLEEGTKGSTFAKATFSASSNRSDIEIDDPNFWEKWAKKANLDVDELKNRNELIIQEPRRRTQTRRFGTDDHMLDLSDLESSDDDDESISTRTRGARCRNPRSSRNKNRNKGRAFDKEREDEILEDIAPGNWTRAECFKVEKGLLTFGWGRWEECLALGNFRRRLTLKDVEDISRTVLLYCLLHYKGDEKIKGFIWDLITPTVDGETRIHRNHSGLSAPVPRGRKGKKMKKDGKSSNNEIDDWGDWAKEEKYNPENLLNDDGYKKHLHRHSNKVLLRVRLLYYLKHEVIGDLEEQVAAGLPVSEIALPAPGADGEPPVHWWDEEADKSLLVGVYKHGYERYNVMRQDPTLCFLYRCGPPDGAALLAEMNVIDDELDDQVCQKEIGDKDDKDVDDLEALSPAPSASEVPIFNKILPPDDVTLGSLALNQNIDQSMFPISEMKADVINPMIPFYDDYWSWPSRYGTDPGLLPFPTASDLNTRLRRIITAYQRSHKKQELKLAQKARKIERREKFEAAIRERELKKRELQQRRWSRREEADFYRTISSFGVEYKRDKHQYDWTRFRAIARLERKYDETLAEYFKAFYAMCKRVCGRKLTEEEEQLPLIVEPISEERASRCLQRIDLLNKIREEILFFSELDERLKLCQPSMDLPDWWLCGKHDKDLLIGAARHGLSRMDYHLLHDPDLCFKDVLKNHPHAKTIQISSHMSTPTGCSSPVTAFQSAEEKDDVPIKEETKGELVKEETSSVIKSIKEEPSSVIVKANKEELCSVIVKASKDDITETNENKDDIEVKSDKEDAEESKVKIPNLIWDDKVEEEEEEKVGKSEDEKGEFNFEVKANEVKDENCESILDLKDSEGKDSLTEPGEYSDLSKDEESELKIKDEPVELEKQKADVPSPEKFEEKCKNTEGESAGNEGFSEVNKEPVPEVIPDVKPKDDPLQSNLDDSQEGASQNDDLMSQESFSLELDGGEPTVAQLLALTTGNSVRWPKDKVLQIRLEHIVHAVEKNEWPVIRPTFMHNFPNLGSQNISLPGLVSTSTPLATANSSPHRISPVPSISSQGQSGEATPQATPEHTPHRESVLQDVQISPSDFGSLGSPIHGVSEGAKLHRRRRRRRRFEIEAERAKLRALLSHNMQQHHQQLQQVQPFLTPTPPTSLLRSKIWDDAADEKSVLATSTASTSTTTTTSGAATSSSGPPPAHQNSAPRMTAMGTLDLRVKPSPAPSTIFTPRIPEPPPEPMGSPSSPMDLSSTSAPFGLPAHYQSSSRSGHQISRRGRGSPPVNGAVRGRGRGRGRGRWVSRGGSRIDALALNLQARKQQQMLEEQQKQQQQNESLSFMLLRDQHEKYREHGEAEEGQQQEKHAVEEETRLKKKRLSFGEDSVRNLRNRNISMGFSSAHDATSTSRIHAGSKHEEGRSTSSLLDQTTVMHHDFKKWLEDHPELVASNPNLVAAAAAAMAFNPLPSFPPHTELLELPEGRRRGRRPRIDPTKLDFDKLTGEENVSVVNRLTGKKITGSKAPPLKHLAEWLEKNPMFDVDPKWGPLVREKGNLPDSLQKRIVIPSEKRGRRTAASLLASAHQNIPTPSTTMNFPSSSSINPLNFANTGMLAGFPGMKFFMDSSKGSSSSTTTTSSSVANASTPPIFLPFGGLAGMGLTNPLFGFPGFNFQGLQGAAASLGNSPSISTTKEQHDKDGDKGKGSDKTVDNTTSAARGKCGTTSACGASSGTSSSSINAATSLPSATSLPFLYPTHGLLYNPLGLGGFTLPPNLPASFASLTQSGLVNGLGSLGSSLASSTTSVFTTSSSTLSTGATTIPTPTQTTSILSSSKMATNVSGSRGLPSHNLLSEGQDSDDESLKSLMGNHDDDDDDDLYDGKLENSDNLEKEDSDRENVVKNEAERAPALSSLLQSENINRSSNKISDSEAFDTSLGNLNSFRHSVELHGNKPKSVSDDPTSDSTDTEGKFS